MPFDECAPHARMETTSPRGLFEEMAFVGVDNNGDGNRRTERREE